MPRSTANFGNTPKVGVPVEAAVNPTGQANVNILGSRDGALYFDATSFYDPATNHVRRGLWALDSGVLTEVTAASAFSFFDEFPDAVYFSTNDLSQGRELLRDDGTKITANDIIPGPGSLWPTELTAFNNDLLFIGNSPAGVSPSGSRLWHFDTTTGDAVFVDRADVSDIPFIAVLDNTAYVYGDSFLRVGDASFRFEFNAPIRGPRIMKHRACRIATLSMEAMATTGLSVTRISIGCSAKAVLTHSPANRSRFAIVIWPTR